MTDLTFRITQTGRENSKTVFQTTDWYEAKDWISQDAHAFHVIHYDGVEGMSIKNFNKLYDHQQWPIKAKKVIIE